MNTFTALFSLKQRASKLRFALAAFFGAAAVAGVSAPAQAQMTPAQVQSDQQVRALFASWRQSDRQRQGLMAIPSGRPVESFRLTSSFGTRSDPFGRGRRRHNGLDMAGPVGTPIYATADGIVGRSQWVGGYGKYIEINHGGGIQTRYGHMSRLLVQSGARVTRGQMIGRMGSTGRSTGSHLHYEVRVDGRPLNPTTFLTSGEYLASLPDRAPTVIAQTDTPAAVGVGASQ